jgi:hypothetical protein
MDHCCRVALRGHDAIELPAPDGQKAAGLARDGGKFCRDGLQGLEEDDDMLTAMARELVTEKGIGESAAAVWRQIQAERANIVPPATIRPEQAPAIEDASLTTR